MRMSAAGLTNSEMALERTTSIKTIDMQLLRLYRKLNIHSRYELLAAAFAMGLVPHDSLIWYGMRTMLFGGAGAKR